MSDITLSQVKELADPKLHAIAKRVLKVMQLEAEKTVAHHRDPGAFPTASDANSGEQIFAARFKELTPAKQQAAIVRTMAFVNAPEKPVHGEK